MAPSPGHDFTDKRKPWDWETRYPGKARRCINNEAFVLGGSLLFLIALAGLSLALAANDRSLVVALPHAHPTTIDTQVIAVFFCGNLGGTTFSIKWLIHTVSKGSWHLDRRYWRFFVPLIGGVYACVVLTMFNSGLIGGHGPTNGGLASNAALAFLIGYFSDGVSGLLTNVANAVFGTLRDK